MPGRRTTVRRVVRRHLIGVADFALSYGAASAQYLHRMRAGPATVIARNTTAIPRPTKRTGVGPAFDSSRSATSATRARASTSSSTPSRWRRGRLRGRRDRRRLSAPVLKSSSGQATHVSVSRAHCGDRDTRAPRAGGRVRLSNALRHFRTLARGGNGSGAGVCGIALRRRSRRSLPSGSQLHRHRWPRPGRLGSCRSSGWHPTRRSAQNSVVGRPRPSMRDGHSITAQVRWSRDWLSGRGALVEQPAVPFAQAGTRVARARRDAAMDQRELATRLDVRLWTVERIETGSLDPRDLGRGA